MSKPRRISGFRAFEQPKASLAERVSTRRTDGVRSLDSETERRMRNWARWKCGVPISLATSGAYELEARGRREAVSSPLLAGEALDVDDAVESLAPELQRVVREWWLPIYTTLVQGELRERHAAPTVEQKARWCRCHVSTLYRRLDHAHARIEAFLQERRKLAEQRRRGLSGAVLAPLQAG